MGTVEATLTASGAIVNGGVDAVFLLQWMAVIVMAILIFKMIKPYMPFLDPIFDMLDPTLTTLEKALPKLKDKGWFKSLHTASDVITTARGFVKLYELDKTSDPTGELRRSAMKKKLRETYGAKQAWTPEQEKAIDDIIDAALANEGLIGKAAAGIMPAQFRDAVVPKDPAGAGV